MLLPLNWHFFWSFSPHGYFCQYRPQETTVGNFYLRGWWLGKWMLTEILCIIYRNPNFLPRGKKYRERLPPEKNKHLKNPHHHPHNFVHGSSLPFKKADCLLFTLSCNYIMIYVRLISSFSQKFTLVSRNLGTFVAFSPATKLQSMLASFCHKSWTCYRIDKTLTEES